MDYEELMSMYRDSLRDKRGVLARQWAQLRASSGGDEEVGALRRCLHQLAGSAGAYGFEALGDKARRLERALGQWVATAAELRAPAAALSSMYLGEFEELGHSLDQAIGTESA